MLPGPRLGYAEMPVGEDRYIVYAETALPASRRFSVPKSSPFDDLNFAIYLDKTGTGAQLVAASVPVPVRGPTATATVAFGDATLTVVATPMSDLAGGLSAALPWVVLGLGLVLSLLTASTIDYVTRGRQLAVQLASENEALYVQQRDIAGTLQEALLPEVPVLEALEVAARYLPGVAGIEVGGDWYDVVESGPGRCTFVVGDVSGRGLVAAKTMAALRYATRAYLAQGDGPEAVLAKLGHLLDFEHDHQFATVLIGEIDVAGRRVTPGERRPLPPLLLAGGRASYLELPVGVPVGVRGGDAPRQRSPCRSRRGRPSSPSPTASSSAGGSTSTKASAGSATPRWTTGRWRPSSIGSSRASSPAAPATTWWSWGSGGGARPRGRDPRRRRALAR